MLHNRFNRDWVDTVFLTIAYDSDYTAVVIGSVGKLGNLTSNCVLNLNTRLNDDFRVLCVALLTDFHHCSPSSCDNVSWTAASECCSSVETAVPSRRAEKLVLAPLRVREQQAGHTFGTHAVLMRVTADRGHARHSEIENVRSFESSPI